MPEALVSLPVVFAVAGTILVLTLVVGSAVALRFNARSRFRKRLASVTGATGRARGAKGERGSSPRRHDIQTKLKELEAGQKKSKRRYHLRAQLQQAGLALSVRNFFIISAVAGAAIALAYVLMGLPPANAGLRLVVALLVGIMGALWLPKFVIRFLTKRRITKFTSQFADAVDVIVRGIKTGLPVGECLGIIGRESPEPVRGEFQQITEAQKLGVTLDEALERALERMPTAELKFFAIVLSIQQQTGGNLAETLGNLSGVLRERKKMRDKVKAMTSEARMSTIIIGSMPIAMCGLFFLVRPDLMLILFTDTWGQILVALGLLLMGTGSLIMKKMIAFEI